MPCTCSQTLIDALLRVFVHPPQYAPQFVSARGLQTVVAKRSQTRYGGPQQLSPLAITQRRHFRGPNRQRQTSVPVSEPARDESIASQYINLVAADGTFYPGQRLNRILQSVDRDTHALQMVMPGNSNLPRDDRNYYPTCRIFTKVELAEARKRREQSVVENAKKTRKIETGGKVLELSWAIGENDLAHRMKRAKEFLEEGRRLDITLLRKKGNRTVTEKECRRLVDAIEGELEQVPGAEERKDPEGEAGKILTLYWQGKEAAKVREKPDS